MARFEVIPDPVQGAGAPGYESRFGDAAWWATGLALVPLLMVGIFVAYGVAGALAGIAAPSFDPSGVDSNILGTALGYGLLAAAIVGPFYLVLGVLFLAALRRLAGRGWTRQRLRRMAVITGIVAAAPFYPFIPAGALYGLIVPLPGAGREERRRVLWRTCAGVVALIVVLAPLSLLVD